MLQHLKHLQHTTSSSRELMVPFLGVSAVLVFPPRDAQCSTGGGWDKDMLESWWKVKLEQPELFLRVQGASAINHLVL